MSENDLLNEMTVDLIPADKGLRFANFIIDVILFYVLAFIIGIVMALVSPETLVENGGSSTSLGLNLIFIVICVFYFSLLEGLTKGKTLGKLITKTRAVKEDGSPITFSDAFKRSLSRMVPFEPFSALGDRPWHDKWTDTIVIKEN